MKFKFVKKNYIYIISALIVLLFYMIVMIYNGIEPFGTKSFIIHDNHLQIYPFLSVFRRKILNGDSLFYIWNCGLGNNYLATYFYYLASPINFLVILFPEDKINLFLDFSIVLRGILSTGTFAFYLSSRNKGENDSADNVKNFTGNAYIIALAVAYALSSFVCSYSYSTCWMDTYVVFPIVMYGYNRLINEKKPVVYIISLAYMAYCCFYMAYIVGFFLVINFLLDKHKNVKNFFINTLYFGISSATAACMTAVPIMVCFFSALSSGNGSQSFSNFSHEWFGNIFEVLRYQFFLAKSTDLSFIYNDTNIYCGVFAIVAFFIYAFGNNISISDKIRKFVMIIFLIVSMNETYLNFIWHGLHAQLGMPNRFSFLFIFIVLDLVYETFGSLTEINNKGIITGLVCSILYPVVCYFFVNYIGYVNSHLMLTFNMVLIVIYGLLILVSKSIINEKIISNIIMLFMSVEILVNAFFCYGQNNMDINSHNDFLREVQDAIDNAEKKSDSFYRSDIVDSPNISMNLLTDINGYSTFNTFLYSDLRWTDDSLTGFTSGVAVENRGLNAFLEDFYGLRYLYIRTDNLQNDNKYNYMKVYENETLKVYENKDYLNLGFAVNDTIGDVTFSNISTFDNMNIFTDKVLNGINIFEEKNFEYMINTNNCKVSLYNVDYPAMAIESEQLGSYVTFDFSIDEAGQYYAFFESDQSVRADIIVNDIVQRELKSNFKYGTILIGCFEKGDSIRIKVYNDDFISTRRTDGGSRQFISMKVAKEDIDSLHRINDSLRTNQLNVTKNDGTGFFGQITLDNNQVLLTTVPYDKGWHVYEEGKEIPIKKYLNAFMGVPLSEGTHNLEFKYVPQGFVLGIIVSVVTWIIFIVYLIVGCRKKSAVNRGEKSND